MEEGIPFSCALPPLLPLAKVVGKTFRYIRLQSDPYQFFACLLEIQVPSSPLPAEGL
jgi:hypothetical protein